MYRLQMLITVRNWMTLVADSLDMLPVELRSALVVRADVVGPLCCSTCHGGWFRLTPDGPRCYLCHDAGFVVAMLVELRTARPRIAISRGERILASAVLQRLPTCIELAIPEAQGNALRVNGRTVESSAEALQARIRSVLFPELGLACDAEGAWGRPGGERLLGGRMIPTFDEILEQAERQG